MRVVALATLAIVLLMPKIELDAFDAPIAAMSFTTAQPQAEN